MNELTSTGGGCRTRALVGLVLGPLGLGAAQAQTRPDLERDVEAFCAVAVTRADGLSGPPEACDRLPRLRSFEPNYAIVQRTEGDEDAIEARLSLR